MEQMHEYAGVIGTIDPQTVNNSEIFSDVIDMAEFDRVECTFLAGSMNGSTGSLTCRCVTCDSSGNNVHAMKTAATIVAPASADQVIIEVDNNDLAGGSSALYENRYIKFGMVSGATGGPVAAVIKGKAKNHPSSDLNLATVKQILIAHD
jgi:hypothetical protein